MSAPRSYFGRLARYYGWFAGGFGAFLAALALLEKEGMPRVWIGYLFMLATITLYAAIGVLSRTSNVTEYYVAGRRVPALFNGMATAADWISAASFISLAGGLYLHGFDGLAYIMGWTGGYCLVALLIAPYLRKFAQYTIPDFLAARYGGGAGGRGGPVRVMAVAATIAVSFTYVVAQIYAVGLIASRFTGVDFSVGIFLGLASILVCSFLGGMRAITWTQVAQYIIILVAFLIPTLWLSVKHADNPLPQVAYGAVLPKLAAREAAIERDPRELQVRAIFAQRAAVFEARIKQLPASWESGRLDAQRRLDAVRLRNAPLAEIRAAERALIAYPKSADDAARQWSEARTANLARALPPEPHAAPFPGEDRAASDIRRNNFLALVFCLMFGTAALPHILMRAYTTPSVDATRISVFWTLFFILLVYLCIPALAVLVKYDIYYKVVDPAASTQKRVTISKLLLLAVAFIAAYAASQKPADILSMVGAAFSLAASTLFPALVLGVFWKRANHAGALAGMLAGLAVCVYYMFHTNPILGGSAAGQWWHIAPISAGVFGVPAGLAVLVLVSLLTRAPGPLSDSLVDHVRAPE